MVTTFTAAIIFLLTDNILVLASTWVASGLMLAGMIGHVDTWPEAQQVARKARKTFLTTDWIFVCGLTMAALRLKTLAISDIVTRAGELPTPMLAGLVATVIVAALARCAVPPFSGWLLASVTAPTPVSAMMHAGLVNAGGFLLIRMSPVIELLPAARLAMVLLGLFGAIVGAAIMIVRPDVKRALAASTVSQMGFMVMTCGLGAYAAALWHILAHGLFKAWLFLGAGQVVRRQPLKAAEGFGFKAGFAIGATGIGLTLVDIVSPLDRTSLIPTALTLVAAIIAMLSAIGDNSGRQRWVMAALISGLVVIHSTGLGFVSRLLPSAQSPLPMTLQMFVAAIFLGSLVVQNRLFARRWQMPRWIYVRLLSAGAMTR
ncbi:proton-conducting transporter membrane subunit [Sphingobium sp. KCTC 72723]|uniref:proton-conducting transporter transmembrane domain-containing protein n=1 Tax=Sphingobium sp. KCTC 72723 TaxID=2733867 RepID=UPI003977A142